MTLRICFIQRKNGLTPSIERVFDKIGHEFEKRGIEVVKSNLPFGNGPLGLLGNLIFYRAPSADVLHITGQINYIALRLPAETTLLTVHDLGILRRRRGLRLSLVKKLFFDRPFRRLRIITAISESTRLEMIEKCDCPPEKITVISNPLTGSSLRKNGRDLDSAAPVVLQVGTAPHKNLDRVIEAIKNLQCRLLVVGRIDEKTRKLLQDENIKFENPKADTEGEMRAVYARSDLVVFCSTFEGFGLPIIEAQSMGVPVVTSDLPPMNQVAGDAAVFADPFSVVSIRTSIERIINEPNLRHRLIEGGYKNIERFDPAVIADQYLRVYEKLLSRKVLL